MREFTENKVLNSLGYSRVRWFRGVAKEYLQGYLDFLALVLNEGTRWFRLIIPSDYSPILSQTKFYSK